MGRLPLPERCVLNKEKARELGIQTGFSVQSCEHHQNSLAEGAWKNLRTGDRGWTAHLSPVVSYAPGTE